MRCATAATSNSATDLALVIDPTYSGDGSACLWVAMTGGEYIQLTSQPKATPLDQESATQIATAFFFFFAVVFAYRVLRRLIESSEPLSDEKH